MNIQNSLSPLVRSHRPLRRVLIGTSLGEESDQVVRMGLAVARAAGARVYLAHAAQLDGLPRALDVGAGAELDAEILTLLGEELDRQIERLNIQKPELAGSEVRTGSPYRILTEAARQTGAGLIVVGATGSGPLAAELLGSTADRVLRKAFCPVLVVRGELRLPPRRVLAPVDLSKLSGDVLHCGLHLLGQLAGRDEIHVRVVHALSFLDALAARQRTGGTPLAEIERSTAEELQRFLLENRPEAPFRLEAEVLPGEARVEILRDLEEHPVDLLVMGTHGRGGLDRLMLGSVVSTVARKAPCSVLVIPPDAALEEGVAEAVESQTAPAWHRELVPVL